ncbi:MAG TPA: hypothetical protein VHC20_05095 [Candidatus Paceibacterota bacterium]|nr:hypothetical protein [Candidatus Paceibacterota bacterium]
MSATTSTFCADCGPAQANHAALWFANTTDTFTLSLPRGPLSGTLAQMGNSVTSLLGHIAFYVARMTGALTLSSDRTQTCSNRTKLLWEEAARRGIDMQQLMFFGKPSDTFVVNLRGRMRFFKSLPLLATDDAALRMDDKIWFKRAMRESGYPVPKSIGVRTQEEARAALAELGMVCVKPRTGSNGRHTYPYVKTEEDLAAALASVKKICAYASVEEQLEGNLCRATCVNGKLIGFFESGYPSVVGDGSTTIRELITQKNAARVEKVEPVEITASHEGYIRRRGYTLDSVLPAGVELPLTYRAGYGQGGWNREHGRAIHPSFIPVIEGAAKRTGLSIVGFDIIIPDPQKPANEQRWGFIEANSLPWVDLHSAPLYGTPIDVSPAVWDMWAE